VFIDFKKALNSLWMTMKNHNSGRKLVTSVCQTIGAVLVQGAVVEQFHTSGVARQGHFMSPT